MSNAVLALHVVGSLALVGLGCMIALLADRRRS